MDSCSWYGVERLRPGDVHGRLVNYVTPVTIGWKSLQSTR